MLYEIYQQVLSPKAKSLGGSIEDLRLDPEWECYFEATHTGEIHYDQFNRFYHKICLIEADSLDEVFQIGNIGPQSRILERNEHHPMHSISVGDVIQDESGKLTVVKPYGFGEL